MMKNVIFLFLFCFLFSCDSTDDIKKEYDPQLPPVTTIGANTFGCKIDGKIMIPRNSIGYLPPGSRHYPVINLNGINGEYTYIQAADRRETQRGGVFLYLQNEPNLNTFEVGEYDIFNGISPSFLNDNYKNYVYVTRYVNGVAQNYKSIENTGKIIITKSENSIFSGTFYCKVKNVEHPFDIIDITEGRFDINKSNINSTNFP
jgi:hypothetical protein